MCIGRAGINADRCHTGHCRIHLLFGSGKEITMTKAKGESQRLARSMMSGTKGTSNKKGGKKNKQKGTRLVSIHTEFS